MIRKRTSLLVLAYGLFLIVMGLLGYRKASLASLYSGAGSGILLTFFSYFMFKEKRWAQYLALTLTSILLFAFLIRYFSTYKTTPAILGLTTCLVLILQLTRLRRWHQ
jgi:uncharacterized membrane protein (UPF0136 family)